MKKIGVITLYYQNPNYGGQLQAYALPTALQKLGYQAEQICFDDTNIVQEIRRYKPSKLEKVRQYGTRYLIYCAKTALKKSYQKIEKRGDSVNIQTDIQIRQQAFQEFERHVVPHSEQVYDADTIVNVNDDYDSFICGSDQLWNPVRVKGIHLLTFATPDKSKIAYAASVGRSTLSDPERQYFQEALRDFKAVSVREKSSIPALCGHETDDFIQQMPDPTFLLKREDWDDLLQKQHVRIEHPSYILVYLLGDNAKQRRIIAKYAKAHGKQVVFFPHILGKFRKEDLKLPCIPEYACGPDRFVGLIKSADMVITDSFHAIVFSLIYQTPFVALKRDKLGFGDEMLNRILDLLKPIGFSDRLIDNHYNELCKATATPYNFTQAQDWIQSESERGYAFLRDALESRE